MFAMIKGKLKHFKDMRIKLKTSGKYYVVSSEPLYSLMYPPSGKGPYIYLNRKTDRNSYSIGYPKDKVVFCEFLDSKTFYTFMGLHPRSYFTIISDTEVKSKFFVASDPLLFLDSDVKITPEGVIYSLTKEPINNRLLRKDSDIVAYLNRKDYSVGVSMNKKVYKTFENKESLDSFLSDYSDISKLEIGTY